MKELAQEAAMHGDKKGAMQVAVLGSIGLYLNVLNIFLIILNLLGFVSND
jgi:FtsH-binding integral membrane protein